jgi:hypothetical protein
MHRHIVMKSWGPLSCQSSANITSCFSMIMHDPMTQGSIHIFWKLKMFQFFHGLHTHSPNRSHIEHVWDALDWRVWQRVPTNIQQLCTVIEEEWDNIQQATINSLINSMWRRCVMLDEANCIFYHIWTGFLIHSPTFFKGICDQQMHICIPRLGSNLFISIDWFPYMNCNSVKSLKLLHVALMFLFSVYIAWNYLLSVLCRA